jgi:hypothetical protein
VTPALALQRAFFAQAAETPATAPAKATGPNLDANGEPRFLEQVKLFFESGASKTDIDKQWLNLIKACQTVVRFNIPLRRDNGDL